MFFSDLPGGPQTRYYHNQRMEHQKNSPCRAEVNDLTYNCWRKKSWTTWYKDNSIVHKGFTCTTVGADFASSTVRPTDHPCTLNTLVFDNWNWNQHFTFLDRWYATELGWPRLTDVMYINWFITRAAFATGLCVEILNVELSPIITGSLDLLFVPVKMLNWLRNEWLVWVGLVWVWVGLGWVWVWLGLGWVGCVKWMLPYNSGSTYLE